MKKIIILSLALFIAVTIHDIYAVDTVSVKVEFQKPRITRSTSLLGYYHIEMENTRSLGEVGEPQLPVKGVNVLIPPGKEIGEIKLDLTGRTTLSGSYKIEPGQKEYPISQMGKITIVPDMPKPEIYESDSTYPSARYNLVSIQKKMGYPIAVIQLFPVEYKPKSGKISYYKEITVHVKLKASRYRSSGEIKATPRLRADPEDEAAVYRLIDNNGDIAFYKSKSRQSPGGEADTTYVIITHKDFVESFEDLRVRRERTHGGAAIVTTDDIYKNYSGVDEQDKIRNFIRYAYNNWKTKYVLLGGDGDGADVGGESGDGIIPARGLSALDDNNIPADLYYACLDGNFDNNKNGIYGEVADAEPGEKDIDLFAEVCVGRAPVDSVTEADNFVRKTLAYEDSDDDYLENSYMLGEWVGGLGAGYSVEDMEEIRLGKFTCGGFATYGFMSNPNRAMDPKTLYDCSPENHSSGEAWCEYEYKCKLTNINIINSGVHILNHTGHSLSTNNMKLSNDDVDNNISNDKYFIVYSQGCYSGSFDNRTGDLLYNEDDCIAEHFVAGVFGAVAYIGNSRFGKFGSGERYNRLFWDALFGERNIRELGQMNQYSKEANIFYDRYSYFSLNVLGDPALVVHVPDGLILQIINYNCIKTKEEKGDCYFSAGETGELTVTIRALNQDASNVSAILSSDNEYVNIEQNYASYGDILKGEYSIASFKFKIYEWCPVPLDRAGFIFTVGDGLYTKQEDILIKTDITPPINCCVEINGGDKYTNSTIATLTLLAIDVESGVDQMKIVVIDNVTGYELCAESYSTSKLLTLSSSDGRKAVYVKFSDKAGNWSEFVCAEIFLDTVELIGAIEINSGDKYTSSTSVMLNLDTIDPTLTSDQCADDVGSSVSQMQFSNDRSKWSKLEPYSNTKTWRLPTVGDGDVDGSGRIISWDALLVLKYINDPSKAQLTPNQLIRADVNGDGEILLEDALNILKLSVKKTREALGLKPVRMSGEFEVYVKFIDAAGNESVVSDTIIIK